LYDFFDDQHLHKHDAFLRRTLVRLVLRAAKKQSLTEDTARHEREILKEFADVC